MRLKLTSKATKEKADRLGESYMRSNERLKALAKEREIIADTIKALATDFAEDKDAKRRLVVGNRFVVGYTLKEGSPTIDFKRLFKKYPHLGQLICTVQVDEAKLEKAIQDGELTRKVLSKFIVPSTKTTKAVYVAEKAKTELA